MGERINSQEEMASTSTAIATTVAPQLQEEPSEPLTVITLRPPRKQERKKVLWTDDTVDNEHMNKKKSKCCCIYEKPHKFGESDSEDSSDECEHCFGHVERRGHHNHQRATTSADVTDGCGAPVETVAQPAEPGATITLQPQEGGQPGPPDKSVVPPHNSS